MDAPATWCRLRALDAAGKELATWEVFEERRPDLAVVDELARMALAARRCGAAAVVLEVSAALADLLELTGLGQMGGEPEEREQPGGVEEGVIGGDPAP